MSEKFYQVSSRCPVCGKNMYLARLECEVCQSALEGKFTLGSFQNLNPEQLKFIEVFIRCRGQNKAVQEMLDISYPTVIKKLDELIVALGYEPESAGDRRREILERLSQNKISAVQAQNLLLNLEQEDTADIEVNNEERASSTRQNEIKGE